MASFTVAQSSQTRPTSVSNNNNNHSNSKSNSNSEIQSIYGNQNNYITENSSSNGNYKNNNGITKKDYEYGKSKQYNTDDPGAPTATTTTNISSANIRRYNEFVISERDRYRAGNYRDSIEANAKTIDYNVSAFKWPTEDSANSKTTASANANANANANAIAASNTAAASAAAAEATTIEENNQFTTITKSTLSKIKQNSETECLSNQGTLFTRLAVNAVYSETEFANKEKLKLGDFNIPINVGRRSTDQQSKYDYANKANAIPSGYKHRLLYNIGSESESDVGDPHDSITKFVCTVTTAATIVAFICAIFANANANSNATTKDTSRHGWDSVDRCRRAYVTRVHEWSNAYCYS
uniref:Uncharacterized protein n=1 Tax=Ceratitis capitata TaxID=7213 RepID=W8AZD4_CERCA